MVAFAIFFDKIRQRSPDSQFFRQSALDARLEQFEHSLSGLAVRTAFPGKRRDHCHTAFSQRLRSQLDPSLAPSSKLPVEQPDNRGCGRTRFDRFEPLQPGPKISVE